MRIIHPLLTLCLPMLLSCAPNAGQARFEITGAERQLDCMQRAFPFEPTDLRAQHHPDSTTLFFQHNPGPIRTADLITIEIFAQDPSAQPIPLRVAFNAQAQPWEPRLSTVIPTDQPAARADLQLLNTCPLVHDSFILEGTLTFSMFGRDPGDQIKGRLDAKLLEARTGATVAQTLTGTFDFTVDHGRTSENLYDARRE
jgi:hypothetical protein